MSNKIKLFKQKAYKRVRVGEWLFEWYIDEKKSERSYMSVKTDSGLMSLRIAANTHVFGYLLAAAEQGLTEHLHGWITLCYIPMMAMTQEQGLTDDVQRAVQKWVRRKDAEAKTAAKNISETQEQADMALMEDIVSEQALSKKELKAKREQDAEIMREILQDKEGEG